MVTDSSICYVKALSLEAQTYSPGGLYCCDKSGLPSLLKSPAGGYPPSSPTTATDDACEKKRPTESLADFFRRCSLAVPRLSKEKSTTAQSLPELRVGSRLWCGAWEMIPYCENFFPRERFGAVLLNSNEVLLMGGSMNGRPRNDVWHLNLAPSASQPWVEMSRHREPFPGLNGQLVHTKWSARERFGCAAVTHQQKRLVCIAGGFDQDYLQDVWVSQDGGKDWICVCNNARWGKRSDPKLATISSAPWMLVLSGGLQDGQNVADIWVSENFGSSWAPLSTQKWNAGCRHGLLAMPNPGAGDQRFLLLGGASRIGTAGREDIAELKISHEEGKRGSVSCRSLHLNSEEQGFCQQTLAVAAQEDEIIAVRPSRSHRNTHEVNVTSIGSLVSGKDVQWEPVDFIRQDGSAATSEIRCEPQRVLFVPSESWISPSPRLILVHRNGVLATSRTEVPRHMDECMLLGRLLERQYGIPFAMWRNRVVPLVLPVTAYKGAVP